MRWCSRCVMPDSRPDLTIGPDGVCAACVSAARKREIDWEARGQDFKVLAGWAGSEATKRGADYDCVAAVSGGKDSTFIVFHAAVRAGLRVLGVSFEPTAMTPLGQKNLDNLAHFCDVVQVKKNRTAYRRMRQIALRDVGDPSWPNHAGIFSTVVREATLRQIPLALWGEPPVSEYAPPDDRAHSDANLDAKWTSEFGGLLGLRIRDMIERGLSPRDLVPYSWPTSTSTLRSRFLGHYFPWDSVAQARFVRDRAGFSWADGPPYTGSLWPFENLDDSVDVAFHDLLAALKYGYWRAHAQLSIEIRHSHRSRNEAIDVLRAAGDRYPAAEEAAFCEAIDMTTDEVRAICAGFANPAIWAKVDLPGRLVRRPECEVR